MVGEESRNTFMLTADQPACNFVESFADNNFPGRFFCDKPPDAGPPDPGEGNLSPEYQSGTETILLVEDLESLRNVIADSLEQLGYRVLSASSGEEAVALSNSYSGEIHLLLADVLMPQMKGPELAQKILAGRPQLKVVYVSGYPERVLAPYGVLEPGTILIQKPFSIKILSAKLRQALESRG